MDDAGCYAAPKRPPQGSKAAAGLSWTALASFRARAGSWSAALCLEHLVYLSADELLGLLQGRMRLRVLRVEMVGDPGDQRLLAGNYQEPTAPEIPRFLRTQGVPPLSPSSA